VFTQSSGSPAAEPELAAATGWLSFGNIRPRRAWRAGCPSSPSEPAITAALAMGHSPWLPSRILRSAVIAARRGGLSRIAAE